jgi:hypothetical protein
MTDRRGREREGGLKLLYRLMEKFKHFSSPNLNKPKKKNVVGLERGPLSLVSTTEELLERKVAAPV